MEQSVIERNWAATWQQRTNQQLLYKSTVQSVLSFIQLFLWYYKFNIINCVNIGILFCQKLENNFLNFLISVHNLLTILFFNNLFLDRGLTQKHVAVNILLVQQYETYIFSFSGHSQITIFACQNIYEISLPNRN